MRKALLGFIMAATVMSPIAAQAQDRGGRFDRGRATSEQRQAASERRAQRVESRSERQESRSERRQSRQAVRTERRETRQSRQSARQAQPAAVVQRQRGDRRRDRGTRQSAYPQAWQGNPNDPRRRHYEELERRNQYRYGTREQRRDVRREVRREDRRDWRNDRRDDRRDWRGDRRADRRDWRRDWNRSSWRSDRRYDWRGWRQRNRSHYRLSPYYAPYRNYRYSRFSIGLFLQPLFYNQRYWINDPWSYRLPYAPAGTRWVRYYNDVILVDTYTGEVIDVIYGFFW